LKGQKKQYNYKNGSYNTQINSIDTLKSRIYPSKYYTHSNYLVQEVTKPCLVDTASSLLSFFLKKCCSLI